MNFWKRILESDLAAHLARGWKPGTFSREVGFGIGNETIVTIRVCPACGCELKNQKCKIVCSVCNLLVENCGGD